MEGEAPGAPLESFEPATAGVPPREAERCGEVEREADTESMLPSFVSAPSPVSALCREAAQASSRLWAPEPGLRRLALSQKRGVSLLAAAEERMAEDLDVCLSGEEIQESLTPFSSPYRLVQEFLQRHFREKEETAARRRRTSPLRFSSLSTRAAVDPCSSSPSLSPLSPLSPACSVAASFKRPLLPLLPVSLNLRTLFRRRFPPEVAARLQSGGEPRYQLLPPLQALCVSRGNDALLLACLAQESPCLRVGPLPGGDILSVHLSPAPVGFLFPAASHLLFFLTPSILHVYAVVLLPAAPGSEDSCPARDLPSQTSASAPSDHPLFRSAETGTLPLFLPSYVQPDLSSPLSASSSGRVCPTVRWRRGAFRLIRLESFSLAFPESLRSRFSSAARAATGAASVKVSPFLSSTADGAVFLSVPDSAPCDASAAASESERRRRRQPRLGDIYQLLLHPGPPGRLRAPARLRRLPLAVAGASGANCPHCKQPRKSCGEGSATFETPPPHTRGEAGVKLLRCFPASLLAVVDDRDAVYIYRLVSEGCREPPRSSLCGAPQREEETGVGRRNDTANREGDARGSSAGAETPRPEGAAGHWLPAFLRSETFPHSAREEREDDMNDSEEETARQRWGVAGVLGSVSRKIRKLWPREASPSPPLCSSRFPPPAMLPVSGLSSALAGSSASFGGRFHGDFLLGPQQTAPEASRTAPPCGLASVSRETYLEAVVNALGATSSETGPWSPTGARYGAESRDRVSSAVAFKGLECVAYLPAHIWRERLVLSPKAPTRAPENAGGPANATTKANANLEADGEAEQGKTRSFLSSFWPSGRGAEPRPTGVEGRARRVATEDGAKEFSDANAVCEDLLLSVVDIVPALTVGPYPTVSLITTRGDRVALRLRPLSRGSAPCSQCGGADLSTQPLSLGISSVLPSPFFSAVACRRNRLAALPPALRPFCGDVASFGGASAEPLPTTSLASCSFYSNGLHLFAASPTLSRLFDMGDRDASEDGASPPAFVSLRVCLPSASTSSAPFFLSACLPLQLPSAPLAGGELPLFFASNDFAPSFCLPPTDGLPPGLDAAQLSSLDLSALGAGSGAAAGSSPSEGALVQRLLLIVCASEILLVAVDRCRAVLSPSSAAVVEGASVLAHPPSPRATAALDASWALETCTASGTAAAVAARTQALGAASAVLEAAESWVRAGPAGPRLERLARDLVQNGSVLAAALPPSLPAPVWSPTLWHCLCEVASHRGSADAALGLFFSLSAPRLWSLEAPPPSPQPVFFLRRLHLASPPSASRQVSKFRVLARRRASERRQVDGADREDDTSLGWWAEEDGEAMERRRGSEEELSPEEEVAPWIEGLAARAALVLRVIADWPICMINASVLDPSVSGSLLSPSSLPTASALPPRLFPLCVRWNAAYLGTVFDALNDLLQFLYLQCLPTSSLSFVTALLASPLSPTALLRRPPSAEHRLEAASEAAERARKALLAVLLPQAALPEEDASGDAREAAEGVVPRVPSSAEYSEQQRLLLGLTLSLLRARAIVYLFLVLQEFSPARQQHVWSLLLGETEDGRELSLARLLVQTPLRALLSGDETLNQALAATQSRGLREAGTDGEGAEDFADDFFCRKVMHALLLLDPTPQRPGSITRRLCASLPWLAATCNVELLLPRWWEAETRDGSSAATLASCRRLSLFVADIFAGFSGRSQTAFFGTAMEHFLASTPQPSPVVALHFALRLLDAALRHDSPASLSSLSSSVACPDVIARAFGAALARGAAKAARESAGAEVALVPIFLARAWVEYLACILNFEVPDNSFFEDETGDEQADLAPCEQKLDREERKRAALQQLQWAALDELFSVYTLQLPPLPEVRTGGRCEQAGTEEETEREARSFGVFGPFRPPGNEFVVSALEWLVHRSLNSGVCTPESRVESPRGVSRSADAPAPQPRFACGELDSGTRSDAWLSPAALRTLQVYLHRRFFQSGKAAQGDMLLRLYRHQGARVESAAVLCALATRGAKQDLFLSDHGELQAGETTKEETDSFSLLLPVTVKAQALRWARETLQEEIDLTVRHARRGHGLHAGAAGEESKGDEGDTPRAQSHGQGRHYSTEAILHLFGRLFRTAEEVAHLSRAGAEEGSELESDRETRKTIQQLAVVRDAIGNLIEVLEKLHLPLWRHLKTRLECQRARALLQAPPTACIFADAEREADQRVIPSYIVPPVSLSGVCTLGQQVETVPKLFHAAQMFFCVPLALRALLFDFRRLVSLTSLALLPAGSVSSPCSASGSSSFLGDSIGGEAERLGGRGEGGCEASLCLELENSPQFPHLQQAAETVRNTAEALLFSFSARLAVAPDSFDSLTGTLDLSGSAADLLERGEASSLIEKVLAVCMYSWAEAAPVRVSAAASPLLLFPVSQAGNLELLCCLETVHAFSCLLDSGGGDRQSAFPLLVAEGWLGLSAASAFQAYFELLNARDRLAASCEALRQGVARLLAEGRFSESQADAASPSLSGVPTAVQVADVTPDVVETHLVSILVALAALWVDEEARESVREGRMAFGTEELHAPAVQTLESFLRAVAEQRGAQLPRERGETEEHEEEGAEGSMEEKGGELSSEALEKARETLAKLRALIACSEEV
ncbi:hypothetical protein TGVAND_286230 [Toxoplasma gondii VAND]|uniref:Uncharacterized protein n=1 Tax=Toxoplasma gondii VAND TaxID=933077 RepID=A0A086Q727_TOXGO|nr:hypothetical protein TGVAND_286230 [Toxoplasma gondii VAND]